MDSSTECLVCPVCLEPITGLICHIGSCSHVFCTLCLETWVCSDEPSQNNQQCPVCRAVIEVIFHHKTRVSHDDPLKEDLVSCQRAEKQMRREFIGLDKLKLLEDSQNAFLDFEEKIFLLDLEYSRSCGWCGALGKKLRRKCIAKDDELSYIRASWHFNLNRSGTFIMNIIKRVIDLDKSIHKLVEEIRCFMLVPLSGDCSRTVENFQQRCVYITFSISVLYEDVKDTMTDLKYFKHFRCSEGRLIVGDIIHLNAE